MSQVGMGIAGLVTGSLMQLGNAWAQYDSQRKANNLAKKQYEAARLSYINEEQARAKADGKEVDLEGLLADNTSTNPSPTDLTRGKSKLKLYQPTTSLGGSNAG